MRFRIVNAATNRGVNIMLAAPGHVTTLRAQVELEPSPRGCQIEWVVSPPKCLTNTGRIYTPDYLRKFTVNGPGSVHAVLRSKAGAVLELSQVVTIQPPPADYEGSEHARKRRK